MSPAEEPGLDLAQLRAAAANQVIGRKIVLLETTTSTNDVVAEMYANECEGIVVFAETQTAARGQYGRHWVSAARKGLWCSLLLRPQIAVHESGRLTDLLARAIAETVAAETTLHCKIKPLNDVYCNARKLAGVLVEMRVEPAGGYAAIAGLGLNVNQLLEDFPAELQSTAGSLAIATGRKFNRTRLAIALLRQLDQRYAELRAA